MNINYYWMLCYYFFIVLLIIWFQLPKTEQDIVEALPPKNITVEVMAGTKVMSSVPEATKMLGEMNFQYQYDPVALKAEREYV